MDILLEIINFLFKNNFFYIIYLFFHRQNGVLKLVEIKNFKIIKFHNLVLYFFICNCYTIIIMLL